MLFHYSLHTRLYNGRTDIFRNKRCPQRIFRPAHVAINRKNGVGTALCCITLRSMAQLLMERCHRCIVDGWYRYAIHRLSQLALSAPLDRQTAPQQPRQSYCSTGAYSKWQTWQRMRFPLCPQCQHVDADIRHSPLATQPPAVLQHGYTDLDHLLLTRISGLPLPWRHTRRSRTRLPRGIYTPMDTHQISAFHPCPTRTSGLGTRGSNLRHHIIYDNYHDFLIPH